MPRRRLAPPLAALALVLAAPLAACGPRQVVVGTGPAASPAASLQFTNDLPQAVNVYARGPDGAEVFLRQVPARSTEAVAVRGVREGQSLTLRVAPVDGSPAITRDNVVVGSGTPVRVP